MRALPVVVLTGARQVGKTTLAQAGQPERTYLTLDDIGALGQAQEDPDSLLASVPLTLDEVQRVPELLLAVKRQVDRRRESGDYLLTGSANLALLGGVAESLAGRAIYLDLAPFCPAEWTERRDQLAPLDSLFDADFDFRTWPVETGDWRAWLPVGGFPSVLQAPDPDARRLWFAGYVQTYLERDLRQLSAVSSLPDFQRLMAITANRTGRLINQSDIARDAGLAQATAHRYLNLIETGCLISRLSPYATNPTTGMVKARKLMWNDCGLAAWLAGIRSSGHLAERNDQGFWLEQAVFQTLQTWRTLDPTGRRVHYWRDRSGHEVDFVLEQDGQLVAVEIRAGGTVGLSDAAGLAAFKKSLGRRKVLRRSVILHAGPARALGDDVHALPWGWMFPDGESIGNKP